MKPRALHSLTVEKPLDVQEPDVALAEAAAQPTTAEPDPVFIDKGTPEFARTCLALSCAGFSSFAALYCVQPILPSIAQEFAITPAQSSLILSMPTLMLALGLFFTGPLSDAIGRKNVMVVAVFLAATLNIACAFVESWPLLLILRALSGLALSGVTALTSTYVAEEINPRFTGLMLGLVISGNAFGGMAGRVVGGVITDFSSWRIALGCIGVMALITAVIFWRLLPASRNFAPSPVQPRRFMSGFGQHITNPFLLMLFALAFLFMGSMVAFFNYLGFHLMEPPFNLSQSSIGFVALVYVLGGVSSAQAGALCDRFGRARVLPWVIALWLCGMGLMLVENVAAVVAGTSLFTIGFFGAHSAASGWVVQYARKARGQAASLYQIFFYMGAGVVGTLGGVMWQSLGWVGVCLMIATMLVMSFGLSWKLFALRHG
jgi:MFS transporter, YNFM family, putative membrane transport protein